MTTFPIEVQNHCPRLRDIMGEPLTTAHAAMLRKRIAEYSPEAQAEWHWLREWCDLNSDFLLRSMFQNMAMDQRKRRRKK